MSVEEKKEKNVLWLLSNDFYNTKSCCFESKKRQELVIPRLSDMYQAINVSNTILIVINAWRVKASRFLILCLYDRRGEKCPQYQAIAGCVHVATREKKTVSIYWVRLLLLFSPVFVRIKRHFTTKIIPYSHVEKKREKYERSRRKKRRR